MFKKIFLYLYQLPQNICGLVLSLTSKEKRKIVCKNGKELIVYFSKYCLSGVSLGQYIILNDKYLTIIDNGGDIDTVCCHEYGHSRQSMYLGWLYLIAVGLPSLARNIYDRIAHKNWEYEKRYEWYYSAYPENWSDRLGEVKRNVVD